MLNQATLPVDNFAFKGEVKWIKTVNGILVAESDWMQNKIVGNDARGIYLFLDRLTGINTYTANISHAELGDSVTPATAADTALGNALVRASISASSRSGLLADFRFFFADALTPNDIYTEFGMYVDGAAGLGTGRIFNHLIFGTPLDKAAGEDHTVLCRITGSV